MKNVKTKLLAIYMILLGLTALMYLVTPLVAIIFAIYHAFHANWMVATFASSVAIFAHITSEWYFNFFMDQHYSVKEIILELKK